MIRSLAATWWLCLALLLAASHAHADQPTEESLDWDCWIQESSNNPASISCIRDRGNLVPQPSDNMEDELEQLLLDNIHYRIHSGDTSELGLYISEYIEVFRRGSIWSIDTHEAPYDSSWEEGRPQILVRTLLCPGHMPCKVTIKRPDEPFPPPQAAKPPRKKKRL